MTMHDEHDPRGLPRRVRRVATVAVAALALAGATTIAAQAPQDSVTPAMVALGDSIFHGKVGGALCVSCHGPAARGMPGLGPDLTDATWLHGDGSLSFIATIVKSGVAKPKKSAAMMPPNGGAASLSSAQLRALAAYLHSLRAR